MKLVLSLQIGDGEPCGTYLHVVPFEYESRLHWLSDLREAFDKAQPSWHQPNFSYDCPNLPGLPSGHISFRHLQFHSNFPEEESLFTFQEFLETNSITVLELHDWFNQNNGRWL